MTFKCLSKTYLSNLILVVIVLITSYVWGTPQNGTDVSKSSKSSESGNWDMGVYVITHDEIIGSGARHLADVLKRVPGIRISTNISQSMPSAGPMVLSDSATELASNQFSRIQLLFNGHSLNKKWYGGADQDWGTGFLEGLKEIRVYTGPSAAAYNGRLGAMEMIIDLIPFDGSDEKNASSVRLSQSVNEDRLDKSQLHFRTGDLWGEDGDYSFFGDVTRWAGADVLENWDSVDPGNRMDRKNTSFQVGTVIKKGNYDLMARHLQHYHFDPYYCGRKWSYTFIEVARRFRLSEKWDLTIIGTGDHIVSKWGSGSSTTGEKTGDWDKVTETRLGVRVDLKREFKNTSVFIGADFENVHVEGGPEESDDYLSVMNFTDNRNMGGASLCIVQRIATGWSLRGTVRLEKVEGYSDISFLPELALLFRTKCTIAGLGLAVGHRYMDTWYRVGSTYHSLDSVMGGLPYIVPAELKPERNRQVSVWLEQRLGEGWSFHATAFIGKYDRLMGFDWDYAQDNQFSRLRAREVGEYSYWGGAGSLFYRGKHFHIGANVAYHGVLDSELTARQLYVSEDGNQPLYLSPITANVFLDWLPSRRFAVSMNLNVADSARNAGIDLTSAGFSTIFDVEPFENTDSYTNLDVAVRFPDLWKKVEVRLAVHNVFNDHTRLPLVEGGAFLSRGREITLVLQRRF